MCKVLSYFEHFLIAVNGFILIPVFASLVGIYVGIASFEVRVKISAVTAGIKSCKSIVKNKRKHHDHILLFARLSKFWFLKPLATHILFKRSLFKLIMC